MFSEDFSEDTTFKEKEESEGESLEIRWEGAFRWGNSKCRDLRYNCVTVLSSAGISRDECLQLWAYYMAHKSYSLSLEDEHMNK